MDIHWPKTWHQLYRMRSELEDCLPELKRVLDLYADFVVEDLDEHGEWFHFEDSGLRDAVGPFLSDAMSCAWEYGSTWRAARALVTHGSDFYEVVGETSLKGMSWPHMHRVETIEGELKGFVNTFLKKWTFYTPAMAEALMHDKHNYRGKFLEVGRCCHFRFWGPDTPQPRTLLFPYGRGVVEPVESVAAHLLSTVGVGDLALTGRGSEAREAQEYLRKRLLSGLHIDEQLDWLFGDSFQLRLRDEWPMFHLRYPRAWGVISGLRESICAGLTDYATKLLKVRGIDKPGLFWAEFPERGKDDGDGTERR